jgi:hypothetical protein
MISLTMLLRVLYDEVRDRDNLSEGQQSSRKLFVDVAVRAFKTALLGDQQMARTSGLRLDVKG